MLSGRRHNSKKNAGHASQVLDIMIHSSIRWRPPLLLGCIFQKHCYSFMRCLLRSSLCSNRSKIGAKRFQAASYVTVQNQFSKLSFCVLLYSCSDEQMLRTKLICENWPFSRFKTDSDNCVVDSITEFFAQKRSEIDVRHYRITSIRFLLRFCLESPIHSYKQASPIQAAIQPAELRRKGATPSLACRVREPGHLLHSALTSPPGASAQRLKSWHPFVLAAQQLIISSDYNVRATL